MGIGNNNVVVIGDTNTGKTSIIRMYINGDFMTDFYVTPLPISQAKDYHSPSGDFSVTIWDTAGSEDWESMNAQVYKDVSAVIFVVSIDNSDSLDNILQVWKPKIEKFNDESNYKCFIAINKIDLPPDQHVITDDSITQVATAINAEVLRVSAKEAIGIDDLFRRAAAATQGISPDLLLQNSQNTTNGQPSETTCTNCILV